MIIAQEKRFIMQLGGYFGLFLAVSLILPDGAFYPLKAYTAHAAGFFIKLAGITVTVNDTYVSSPRFSVNIITECTSIYNGALFACFVMAFPSNIYQKAKGILVGITFLDLFNIFRIVVTFWVGHTDRTFFNFVHVYLGEIFMVLVTVWCAVCWVVYIKKYHTNAIQFPFLVRAGCAAALLFVPFVYFQRVYIRLIDRVINSASSFLGGQTFSFHYQNDLYFQTFNMVTLAALILSSRNIEKKIRFIWFSIGMGLLVFFHILFRIGNILLTAYRVTPAFYMSTFIHISGQLLLPVAVWYLMIKRSNKTVFSC